MKNRIFYLKAAAAALALFLGGCSISSDGDLLDPSKGITGKPPVVPDTTPPANVSGFTATAGNSFPLKDTGQIVCFNATAQIACSNSEFPSQDGDFVDFPNKSSFTGPTQHAIYINDYVTIDNVTGLIWQSCSLGQNGGSCSGTAVLISWEVANQKCNDLNMINNGNGFAGKKTWRLPTITELNTLPRLGIYPVLETIYFPAAVFNIYWSSSSPDNSSEFAWGVDFSQGVTQRYTKAVNFYARCVTK